MNVNYIIIGLLITIFLVLAPIEPTVSSYTSPDTIQVQDNKMDNTGYVSHSKIDDAMLGGVRLPFIENIGQADNQVKYYANTFAGTVFVTKDSITYSLHKDRLQDNTIQGLVIKEKFLGTQTLNPIGVQKSESVVNYFVGNEENWKSNVPTYDAISLGQIWQSIDVSLKAHGNNIEKIFTVHPGGNVNDIKLEADGTTSLQTGSDGKLMLDTQLGTISMTNPSAFQYIDGVRKDVQISYYVDGATYGFALGQYNHMYDLVIDPLLASTFIGGNDDDFARELAIDDSGNVYVAGYTQSSNYPVTAGAYNQTYGAGPDVFISKLDSSLGHLLASTYIGGGGIDYAYALVINSGNVYVAGRTESPDFPVTADAYDPTFKGGSDAFISKLDSSLGHLLSSTFIGGSGFDAARTLAIDDSGNVYVAGRTGSFDYPVTAGAYDQTPPYNFDAFVSKLDSSLGHLLSSTFIGGNGNDIIYALAVDSGNVYVTGQAIDSNFPVTSGAYNKTYGGGVGGDTFVSKLDSSLGHLLASTYLGGSGDDIARALVINSGNVYVAGHTNSSNFPVTVGAYDQTYNGADSGAPADGDGGSGDVFVSKLDSSLGDLLASTYLGGRGNDLDFALAVDSGNVYVAGTTDSPNYPVTVGAYDATFNADGSPDAFVSKLDSSLGHLLASTYLGGSGDDLIRALAVDSGNVYVAGRTNSPDYPVTAGAYSQTYTSGYDVFVSKLDSCLISGTANGPSISITTISNSSPRWGVDAVSVSGAASNAVAGDTVKVNWGDGSTTTEIPISCGVWGPVLHTYSSLATSSNPNQVIATLVNSTNFVKASSTPSPVTVQKHTTSLSVPTLNSTSVKWGKQYGVKNSVLTDVTSGVFLAGKTITYDGNGTTGFPTGVTNSKGGLTNQVTITAPGIYNVGKGNIFANFTGDSAYLQSSSATTIQITKHATALSNPTFWTPSVLWGKAFTADSIIIDTDKGVPINGSPIKYSGNGTVTKTDFSNSTGHTVTTLTAAKSTGSGQVSAAFAGDVNYLPSKSGISTITLTPHTTAFSQPALSVGTIKWGKTFTVTATQLTDSDAGGAGLAETITYTGTAVTGIPTGTTISSGTLKGPVTITAPTTVGTGKTVFANFAGDSLYLSSTSAAASITINPHITTLTLETLKNVAWGQSTAFPITLKDSDNAGSAIQGKLIHFNGTGVIGVSDMATNSTGQVVGTGTAPPSAASGWSAQGHFAGDSLYVNSDSVVKTYNTLKHATATSLIISPGTIVHGKAYQVTGTLKDSITGSVLSSRTITFASTSPIVINPATTGSTGAYSVTGLIAPSPGSYSLQALFGGDSLYNSSNSPSKTLTVT